MSGKRFIFALFLACAAIPAGLPVARAQDTSALQAIDPDAAAPEDACAIEGMTGFAWPESVASTFVVQPPYAALASSALPVPAPQHRFSAGVRPQPDAATLTSAPARVFLEDPDDVEPGDIDLPNLTGDGTRLDGLYARVHSDRLDAAGAPAPGKDGLADFRFEPILGKGVECTTAADAEVGQYCSRFDAVNVYYHIDRVAREYWIDRLGIDIDFQADVTTHIAGDGAFANAGQFIMKMGAGDIFMKNTALEDEIIYHEYAHLVTARLGFEIDTESSTEARALSEGYADYFAASYTNDPRIGEWVVTCPARQHCEGPPNDTEFTRLDLNPNVWNWNQGSPDPSLQYGFCLRYHEGDTKCKASYNYRPGLYVWGMIWSNTLWDIREHLGPAAADPLFVEAIRMHEPGENDDVDFEQAVTHVILANRTLNGGENESLITGLFEARGFPVPVIDSVAGDGTLPAVASLGVYPNPAAATAWVEVDSPTAGDFGIRVVDMLGRVVAEQEGRAGGPGRATLPVDISGLIPGVYLVEAVTSSGIISTRLTVVR